MNNTVVENQFFGSEKIGKILLKLAPPIMLAQLIQALYNIVDSYFVGANSEEGLTALSIIYPIQLLICALGIGTGVGINTVMARLYGEKKLQEAQEVAGTGTILALISWVIFSLLTIGILKSYVTISTTSKEVARQSFTYGYIVCFGSIGLFLESTWTKIHQSEGNMKIPMIAQIVGALVNIVLDPILIVGMFGLPSMGITGAAIATIIGQTVAAIITVKGGLRRPPSCNKMIKLSKQIYKAGIPSIVMQALYTVYIVGLNVLLARFSDAAVTVLGLYYKLQAFFFIPLFGLQTCIVPILSYNYAIKSYVRCKEVLWKSIGISAVFMLLGIAAFEGCPEALIRIFSSSEEVVEIGIVGFRLIGLSFIPVAFSLMLPVFFQAIGAGWKSMMMTILRQVILLVPVAWILSFVGLDYVWLTFPITEVVTTAVGIYFYKRHWKMIKNEMVEKSVNKVSQYGL